MSQIFKNFVADNASKDDFVSINDWINLKIKLINSEDFYLHKEKIFREICCTVMYYEWTNNQKINILFKNNRFVDTFISKLDEFTAKYGEDMDWSVGMKREFIKIKNKRFPDVKPPPPPSVIPSNVDLFAMIKDIQTSAQRLEDKVIGLQKQVNYLRIKKLKN